MENTATKIILIGILIVGIVSVIRYSPVSIDPPVVNVPESVVNVPAPIVTISAPEQKLGAIGDYAIGVTNSSKNVGISSTAVLTAKGDRQYASFSECSGYTIWLSFEDTAVEGAGILLTPSLTIADLINPNNPFTGKVYAISNNANARLCYTER